MVAIVSALPLSLLRNFAHETYLMLHRLTAAVAAIALFGHILAGTSLNKILLVVALSALLVSSVLSALVHLYRNVSVAGWRFRTSHIDQVTETYQSESRDLLLRVQLARPCTFKPGQYVQLTVLTLQSWSCVQKHPFAIAWWDATDHDAQATAIYLIVSPRGGWTKNIRPRLETPTEESDASDTTATWKSQTVEASSMIGKRVWLGGPLGVTVDIARYDAFLLFASGYGMLPQLSLLRGLIRRVLTGVRRVRRIVLVWEAEPQVGEVSTWMQSLMDDHRNELTGV